MGTSKSFFSSVFLLVSLILASPFVHAQPATKGPTKGVPVITSSNTAICQVGEDFSYQITARNWPTSFNAIGLPASMRVDTRRGEITGAPTSAGRLKVNIVAKNAEGVGSATLTITVNPETPIITSAASAGGRAGMGFIYQIAARNGPTSFDAAGLPDGLRINTITGAITGTPNEAGTSKVIVSAANAGGTGSAALTLTINPAAPFVTSPTAATGEAGTAFSYRIAAQPSPTSFSATGLPAGLSLNTITGEIAGKPKSAGVSSVTIGANNAWGAGTAILTLSVVPGRLVVSSAPTATGEVDQAFSFKISASRSLVSYSAVGLPAGLRVNASTGWITGTPTEPGTFNVTIGASDAGATGSAALTITINPAITSNTDVSTPKSKLLK
jgi:hypothetical protein